MILLLLLSKRANSVTLTMLTYKRCNFVKNTKCSHSFAQVDCTLSNKFLNDAYLKSSERIFLPTKRITEPCPL